MDTRITGLIQPGDTQDIQKWLENLICDQSGQQSEIREIKANITQLIQQQQTIVEKLSRIEELLQKK